jgi:hypothetical protein
LIEWDVDHDVENVDRPSVSAQSGCRTLKQKNQAYVRNDHHDEDMGCNQSILAQDSSLVTQNHMSNGWVHKRTEKKHVKKCETKHESKSEAKHENKIEAENQ